MMTKFKIPEHLNKSIYLIGRHGVLFVITFFLVYAQATPVGNHWAGELGNLNTSEGASPSETINLPEMTIEGTIKGNGYSGHRLPCGDGDCFSHKTPAGKPVAPITPAEKNKRALLSALSSIDLSKTYNDFIQARMIDKILEHLFGLWGGPIGFIIDVMTPDENGLGTEPFDERISPEKMHELRLRLEQDEKNTKGDPAALPPAFRDPASIEAEKRVYEAVRTSASLKNADAQFIVDQIIRRGSPNADHPISRDVQSYALSIFRPVAVANICIASSTYGCGLPPGKMDQGCFCPPSSGAGMNVLGRSARTLWTSVCKTPIGTCDVSSQAPAGVDCFCTSLDPVIGPFVKGRATILKPRSPKI